MCLGRGLDFTISDYKKAAYEAEDAPQRSRPRIGAPNWNVMSLGGSFLQQPLQIQGLSRSFRFMTSIISIFTHYLMSQPRVCQAP